MSLDVLRTSSRTIAMDEIPYAERARQGVPMSFGHLQSGGLFWQEGFCRNFPYENARKAYACAAKLGLLQVRPPPQKFPTSTHVLQSLKCTEIKNQKTKKPRSMSFGVFFCKYAGIIPPHNRRGVSSSVFLRLPASSPSFAFQPAH